MENRTISSRLKIHTFDNVNMAPMIKSQIGWHFVYVRLYTSNNGAGAYTKYQSTLQVELWHGTFAGSKELQATIPANKGGFLSTTGNTWFGCVIKKIGADYRPSMMMLGYVHSFLTGCEACNVWNGVAFDAHNYLHFVDRSGNPIFPTKPYYEPDDCVLNNGDLQNYDDDVFSVIDMNTYQVAGGTHFVVNDQLSKLKSP